MKISDLIGRDDVVTGLDVTDKPQLIRELARRAARSSGVEAAAIAEALTAREALGSTGVGHGVALPHARVPGLAKTYGCFARLARPIDFDAIDELPVDLAFMLLTPPGSGSEHLAALACVSRRLREKELGQRLRDAPVGGALYDLLVGEPAKS